MSETRGIIREVELKSIKNRIIFNTLLVCTFLLAALIIIPILILINGALSDPLSFAKNPVSVDIAKWNFQSFNEALKAMHMARALLNTFILISVGLVLKMVVTSTSSYSLSKLSPPFTKTFQFLLLCTLVLPGITSLIPKYRIFANFPFLHVNLINTYWPMWLTYSTDAFGIFLFKGFFDGISKEIKEAAEMDGSSDFTFFIRFMIPLSIPVFMILSVFYITGVYADFTTPLIFMQKAGIQPIALAFGIMSSSAYISHGAKLAGAMLVSIPMILIAGYGMRFLEKGITFSGIKG